MRQFIIRGTAFLMIQVLIAGVVVWQGSQQNSNHFFSAFQDKLDRLEQCRGHRLLVLGGSNVAFGIHSQDLQEATGLQTVNLGLQASLGLGHAIACADQHARCGDTVVLIPEYELLISDLQDGEPASINRLLQQCPNAVRYFDANRYSSWKHFLDRDALWQAHQWVKRAHDRIRKRIEPDDVYRRSSFNAFGDVVAHYGRTSEADLSKTLPDVDRERLDEAVEKLNAFAEQCRRRGIDVYLTFPPLPEAAYTASADVIGQVLATLQSSLDIPVLQLPEESVFSRDHFFDTPYHLGETAGAKRTRAIAAALLLQQDSSATISRTTISSRRDGLASRM